MKKILLISYNFAPRHTVGAIRPTKLAQYLAEDRNTVDVVTVKPFGELDHSMDEVFGHVRKVFEIDRPIIKEKPSARPDGGLKQSTSAAQSAPKQTDAVKKKSFLQKIKYELYEYRRVSGSRAFAARFEKLVKSDVDRFRDYDAVITSYGPVASHLCGLVMKKLCPDVKWIADFRDPMVVNTTTALTKRSRASIQNKVCKKADALVAVSQGYFDHIFETDRAKSKATVIYNGFDRRDVMTDASASDGEFSFTYVGALYDGKRDISPLFEALASLIEDGMIDKKDVRFNYAGNAFKVLRGQAARFGVDDCLCDLGRLTRDECLKLQARSRHLVLATWNEKNEGGVFPGKFLEYIMSARPIVSLVAGDLPGSEVTSVMKRGKLGVTYEEATREEDLSVLKEYVLSDYALFKKGMPSDFHPDEETVSSFDFAQTAKSFEKLI